MNKQAALQLKTSNQVPPGAHDSAAKRTKIAAEAAAQDSPGHSKKKSFVGRAWAALVSKPDHSEVGLDAAIRTALKIAEECDYISADHMCEEIEHEIATALNAPGGVYVEYVGAHKRDRKPRILIVTDWRLRRAIYVMCSFSMVHAPERRRER